MPTVLIAHCQCCGRDLPANQFKRGQSVCIHCLELPLIDAIATARATAEREFNDPTRAKLNRKQLKRDKLLAHYAEHGKKCASCWHVKAPSEFSACSAKPSGLHDQCKACAVLYIKLRTAGGLPLWHSTRDALRAAAPSNVAK